MESGIIQDAVIRQLAIIGEASKHISKELKNEIELPWKDIASMRDRLIHAYFGVNLDEVWKTIKEDLPFLKDKIKDFC